MARFKKRLIVVGDRILVRPQDGEERTHSGLYVPQSAVAARQVRAGTVAAVGPGTPVVEPTELYEEPWKQKSPGIGARYVPLQASVGDHVLYQQNAAVEITFEDARYLIDPISAVLVLVREDIELDDLAPEDTDIDLG